MWREWKAFDKLMFSGDHVDHFQTLIFNYISSLFSALPESKESWIFYDWINSLNCKELNSVGNRKPKSRRYDGIYSKLIIIT